MDINPNDLSASVLNAITVNSTTPQFVNLVFMGRGRQCYGQPGNVAFRRIIEAHVDAYVNAINQASKTCIVNQCHGQVVASNLVTVIKKTTNVKNNRSLWMLASVEKVRTKVAHCLRDAVAKQQRAAPNQEMNHDEVLDPGEFPMLPPGVFRDNRGHEDAILDLLNPAEINDDHEVLVDPDDFFPFLLFFDNWLVGE